MKTILLLILMLSYTSSYAQEKSDAIPVSLKDRLKLNNPEVKEITAFDNLVIEENHLIDLKGFTKKMISIYLSDVSDLSFSKSYAVLDNSDGKLFIGGTFNLKSDRYFLTVGAKSNIKDGFANYFKDNRLNNDMGISSKLIFTFRGRLYHDSADESQFNQILKNRKKLYLQKLAEIDDDLTTFQKSNVLEDSKDSKDEFISQKIDEKKEEFTNSENEYVADKELYNQLSFRWISIEGYAPVSSSVYKISNDIVSQSSEVKFLPFSISASGNFWWFIPKSKYIKKSIFGEIIKGSNLFTIKGDLVLNNSILANQITSLSFDEYQSYTPTANNTHYLVKTNSDERYVGEYKEFITPKLSLRYVYIYPFKKFNLGVRLSGQKSFGYSEFFDWKLGIPFSFKDSDGNTKINFEIITQETMKIRSTGINIGLPLQKW
jgi:hypothetical protein